MDTSLSVLLAEKEGQKILSVGPNETVSNAVAKMNDERVGCVLVIDNGKLVGIFTERDVLVKVIGSGKNPSTLLVEEVMSVTVLKVAPTMKVSEAMLLVTERHFRHLPVVDGSEILGMISSGDLMRWVSKSQAITINDLESYINGDYTGGGTSN